MRKFAQALRGKACARPKRLSICPRGKGSVSGGAAGLQNRLGQRACPGWVRLPLPSAKFRAEFSKFYPNLPPARLGAKFHLLFAAASAQTSLARGAKRLSGAEMSELRRDCGQENRLRISLLNRLIGKIFPSFFREGKKVSACAEKYCVKTSACDEGRNASILRMARACLNQTFTRWLENSLISGAIPQKSGG